jgi:predicted metal-binding membrane protein
MAAPVLTAATRRALASNITRWAIAPAAVAWITLAIARGTTSVFCLSPRENFLASFWFRLEAAAAGFSLSSWALYWPPMVVAMMLPLAAPAIRHVETATYMRRRNRSIACFVAGFIALWMAACIAASCGLAVLRAVVAAMPYANLWAALGFPLAALWQLSHTKERALFRCHLVAPLRSYGLGADVDAARAGLVHGLRCVHNCLPTMLLPMIGRHDLDALAVIFVILAAERYEPRPRNLQSAAALLLLGLKTALSP